MKIQMGIKFKHINRLFSAHGQDTHARYDEHFRLSEKFLERVLHADTKKLALHEAGHAYMYAHNEQQDAFETLLKVTLKPDETNRGYAQVWDGRDKLSPLRSQLIASMSAMYGGLVAEELFHGAGNHSAGVLGDIRKATDLADEMTRRLGMSELGAVSYWPEIYTILGWPFERKPDISDTTQHEIEVARKKILDEAKNRTVEVLTPNKAKLETFADLLLQRETLWRKDIFSAFGLNDPFDSLDAGPR